MKRILSFILAIIMSSVCFTGCMTDEEAAEAYEEVIKNVLEEIIVNRSYEQFDVPEDLLACNYTKEDFDILCSAVSSFQNLAVTGTDAAAVTVAADRVEYLMQHLSDQASIANIVYFASMKDEDKAKYEELNDYGSEASSMLIEAYRTVYLSDSPLKDLIFEDYSEQELEALANANSSNIKKYSDTINSITEKYFSLDSGTPTWESTVTDMYISFVENGNLLARECGYDNYYDYSCDEIYMRDYETDKEQYRKYVIEYIIPLLYDRYEAFISSASTINPLVALGYSRLAMDSDYTMKSGYIEGLIGTFDGDIKDTANRMFDGNHIIWGNENAYDAACTVPLSAYNEAVCYFGTGYYGSLATVAHEMGHFISMYHYGADGGSYDFLETHSQSTEVMLLGYLENELNANIFDLYESEKIITWLSTVVIATVVDEFEERIYHSETPVTAEDIDRIIDELYDKYGRDICELLMVRETVLMVVIQYPCYYISYATSALSTLGLYCKLQNEGYDAAYESYERLQRGPLGATFLESLGYAGLPSPFEEDTYKLISDTFNVEQTADKAA